MLISIGRRVPKSWFKRQATRIGGLISFQENIWLIIKQSLQMAKKKANASGKIVFNMMQERESEDINYDIQWIKITIRGTKAQEKEEYEDTMKLYDPLGKIFKKQMPKDDRLSKQFKTKVLSSAKVDEAYKKGYGVMGDKNVANKLLEMGILTHVEWIDDFDSRQEEYKPDF